MDRDQKLSIFRESLGEGVDVDFAQAVLEANDWDLQAALNTVLGDASGSAARLAQQEAVSADGYRAPMRTGYTDTLMAPITPAEERRRQMEREAEQQRLEQEMLARAEARRLAAEYARHEAQARQVEQQRQDAERLALERRRQRQDAEQAERQRRALEPAAARSEGRKEADTRQPQQELVQAAQQPVPPAGMATAVAAQQARHGSERQQHEVEEKQQRAEVERLRQREQEELKQEKAAAEAKQRERETVTAPPKSVDDLVEACVALRKRYKDTDPAGLISCLQTLRVYINNLARNPHEPKFQRINSENSAFRTRVAAFEGATAVLVACGFREEEGALTVSPDFAKTKGPRLWDALAKVDVMLEQLKGGS